MRARSRVALFLLATVAVTYGSLYPFDFSRPAPAEGVLGRLIESLAHAPSRGDVLANLVLYLPIGFFWSRLIPDRPGWLRLVSGAAIGTAMSAAIEFAQLFDVGRDASLWDVALNAISALFGGLAAVVLPDGGQPRGPSFRATDPLAIMIAVCWIGYRLCPFVPTIDWKQLKAALEPLLHASVLPLADTIRHAIAWLAFAMLAEVNRDTLGSRALLWLSVTSVLLAKPWMVGRLITPHEVAGAAVAVVLWTLFSAAIARRPLLIGALTVAMMLYDRTLGGLPYDDLPDGPISAGVATMLQKLFWCGAVLWLLHRHGWPLVPIAIGLSGVLLAVALAHGADFIDPAIALLLGGAVGLSRRTSAASR
jgi:VanZ family protein